MSPGNRAGRLGIGIIGAGKVGVVLARALAGAAHSITGITAISEASRERAAAMLPGVPVLDIPEVVRRSELVIFAIPGDELPTLIKGLTSLEVWQAGQIVMHTAPEHGYGVFEPALASGVIPIAMHPALVFTGTSIDLSRLQGASIAVTAPGPVLPIAQALAVEMGAEAVVVAEHDRAAYADALAAASEFSRAVVRQGIVALREIDVAQPGHLLGGLVRAAIEEEFQRAAGEASSH